MKIIESGELRFIVGELSKKATAELSVALLLEPFPDEDAPPEETLKALDRIETIVNDLFMHRSIKRIERMVGEKWSIAVKGDEVLLDNGDVMIIPETINRAWMEDLPTTFYKTLVDAVREENPTINAFLPGPSTERGITTPNESPSANSNSAG